MRIRVRAGLRLGKTRMGGGKRSSAKNENAAARDTRQERFPILSALALSYHHNAGKPERPYFGNGA